MRRLGKLRRRLFDRAAVGDVDPEPTHAVALVRLFDVEARDLRPARRETARDLAAELAGAAGHDGDLAFE